jgi:glycosyltransferase involved in cell wall biosynthesis
MTNDAQSFRGALPSVSVVIPCRNEVGFIRRCLESIVDQDYPRDRLEVVVVDGMSSDGTREITHEFAQGYPHIRLLDNPRVVTSCGLNIGIRQARGEVIMRADVHSAYPADYLSGCVMRLLDYGADNVGGVLITKPGADTLMARAIGLALSHPIGAGDAYFRIGTRAPRWVDTVPFGCYRREVFTRIGLFDERLGRNQDIEFNHRLRKGGGRILLCPDIRSTYFARSTLRDLWKQSFSNGLWNIRTILIAPGALSWRHFVPLAFVLGLLGGALLSAVLPILWVFWALGAGSYVILIAVASTNIARRPGPRYLPLMPIVFGTLHLSYGLGSLWGLVRFGVPWLLRSRNGKGV